MKIVKPYYKIEGRPNGLAILKRMERAGRTCCKSEHRMTSESSHVFIRKIIADGHESILEHESLTVRFICDRGITHELVRHRLASYAQESTRYCNYTKKRFRKEIQVICPRYIHNDCDLFASWKVTIEKCEKEYFFLLDHGVSPQIARSVLPTCLKTEIVVTANLREWRHILNLRTDPKAHPQMLELMCGLLAELKQLIPVIFEDIETTYTKITSEVNK